MTKNDKTNKYLKSLPRRVADKLITFEVQNNLSQLQLSNMLNINYDLFLKVEQDYPDIPIDVYIDVDKRLENIMNK